LVCPIVMMIPNKRKGFTLIEMLVVVAIIGTLASLVAANITSGRVRARDARRKHDLGQVKNALRLYYNDYQSYPANTGDDIDGCGVTGTSTCVWGSDFTADTTKYMSQLPIDPTNSGNFVYSYIQTKSGEGFELRTYLENESDSHDSTSQLRCDLGGPIDDLYVVCEI